MVELLDLSPADVRILAKFLMEKGEQVAFAPGTQSVTMTVAELARLMHEYGTALAYALCLLPGSQP